MSARIIEHLNSQGLDMARKSSRPKIHSNPIHSGFTNRTNTSLGAPPTGAPPDASSPLPTDPSRQGKSFAVPKPTFGHKPDPQRATYDPALAHAIMDEAKRSPDDFAKSLHTTLPGTVNEK